MEKSKNKELFKTGDIILTQGRSTLSKLIGIFQSKENKEYGKYSHSGLVWIAYGRVFIVEAQKEGIVITDYEEYYEKSGKFKKILLLKPDVKIDGSVFGEMMLPYIGRVRYDFFNLLISQPIKILFDKWIGAKKQRTRRFICHEWTTFMYNKYFDCKLFENPLKANVVDIATNTFFTHYVALEN